MGTALELVVGGLGFGEAPRWHGDRLWYSDFIRQHVASIGVDGDHRVEVELDDRPSGLGWLPDGCLLVVSMRRRVVLGQESDGTLTVHADLSDVAGGDLNDMVVSADGSAYVGNFGADVLNGEQLRAATLVHIRPDGSYSVAADDLMFPNGSVITPDGALLIVGETLAARYRGFAIGSDGSLGDGRVWATTPDRAPDGCTLDAEGGVWFSDARRGEVVRIDADGSITDVIETPDTAYTCMLGGPDGRSLYVLTCASPPVHELRPGSGRLWRTFVEIPHAGLP